MVPGDGGREGFKRRTRIDEARERFRPVLSPVDRTESVPLGDATGRVLAEQVRSGRDVPNYRRAAMDGFAVRARDTFDAGGRSPAVLRVTDGDPGAGEAVPVHTGSPLPDAADAVVMVEDTERVGDEVEVFDTASEGENVSPVGEDVAAGDDLFDPGHRLRPADVGLLKSVGRSAVAVYERPEVAVIPTGEELVQSDPAAGEVVETNGLTVSEYVEQWGGEPRYRAVVADDREALRAAIERDADADVVVTTGGSSVGDRDLVPDVVAELGEVLVHGVALRPGHPVALGRVGETPALVLPGYPVSCIVTAVQFLRPAMKALSHRPTPDFPAVEARLDQKIHSEVGVRGFTRVRLVEAEGERVAVPVRAAGAGVLSSAAFADGWVEVPESAEGIPAGDAVRVQDWDWVA